VINSPDQLWKEFKTHFGKSCEIHSKDALLKAWCSQGDRTNFYSKTVLPEIAALMGLTMRTELFKVDAAFCKASSLNYDVPIIFIESENNAATATHEIKKLCSLNAPCRILITCCEWSPDLWKHGGRQDYLINEWSHIIESQAEVWKNDGILGAINAESGDVFRVTNFAWDSSGVLIEKPSTLLEMKL
jgi:hypothetical protein